MEAVPDSTLKATLAILRLLKDAHIDHSQRIAALEAAQAICKGDSDIGDRFKENVDYSLASH